MYVEVEINGGDVEDDGWRIWCRGRQRGGWAMTMILGLVTNRLEDAVEKGGM